MSANTKTNVINNIKVKTNSSNNNLNEEIRTLEKNKQLFTLLSQFQENMNIINNKINLYEADYSKKSNKIDEILNKKELILINKMKSDKANEAENKNIEDLIIQSKD